MFKHIEIDKKLFLFTEGVVDDLSGGVTEEMDELYEFIPAEMDEPPTPPLRTRAPPLSRKSRTVSIM